MRLHSALNAAAQTQLADDDLGKPQIHGCKQAAYVRRANE
jgi:hypothetical protein